ncbi:MAG: 16S rRNA (adenine(1518)-N(6)/adenine(1519)-N(6))-dimethyltransferase RsmA [Burkholderiaceae bacterium]|jgi:16S rRNA (adenine1518-N6/adenine1519-N6)-dimethyltransferase|nr:16S rRNA (adenine(1518)-N(6)/adenine(1519)-N(6))-dimethyltransferase RsmA [Burkholderiaceae bacterium]
MKHIARKRFGQHFLKDRQVLSDLVAAISPQTTDHVIEIGPGTGALTQLLLKHLPRLTAIEIDRDLVEHLKKACPPDRLLIHQGDVLRFDFRRVITDGQYRLVGNLPYNISTPLLFRLIPFADRIRDQHFMLQKEVVERMIAAPGSKAYGRLSILLQWRYQMDLLFTVPPAMFSPPPRVESAVVRMISRTAPQPCHPDKLEKTVTAAFSQRRKMLRNTLAPLFDEATLVQVGIDPLQRPENLSVEQYIVLSEHLPLS